MSWYEKFTIKNGPVEIGDPVALLYLQIGEVTAYNPIYDRIAVRLPTSEQYSVIEYYWKTLPPLLLEIWKAENEPDS